jgi:hypothetical protein
MSIVWGNNLAQLLNMAPNDLSGMLGWQMEAVFIAEAEFIGLPPFRDSVNSTTAASSA